MYVNIGGWTEKDYYLAVTPCHCDTCKADFEKVNFALVEVEINGEICYVPVLKEPVAKSGRSETTFDVSVDHYND